MSSHYADDYGQDLHDKPPFSQRLAAGSLVQAFSSLRTTLCQHCFRPYDTQDGYQPVPNSEAYDFPSNKPYVAEKVPSASVSGVDPYAPPGIAADQGASFACTDDDPLVDSYMSGYQTLHATNALPTQSGGRAAMMYAAGAPEPGYFGPSSSGRGVASVADVSRAPSFMANHVMSGMSLSAAYGNGMSLGLAGPHSLHRPGGISDNGSVLSYAMPQGYADQPTGDDSSRTGPTRQPSGPKTASGLNVVFPHQKRPPARRGPFQDPVHRVQTAQTRRMGSCIRCRMQRVRCKINTNDENGPCETCTKLAQKAMRLPCIRRKITDIKLFKPGQVQGFEWTRRWKDSIVDNIANWASLEDKIIQVSEGYTTRCVELRVRRFVPQDGDKLERSWVSEGMRRSVPIPPYAIIDLDAAQRSYMDYINRGIVECFTNVIGSKSRLLYTTYSLAWKCAQDQNVPEDERSLLVLTLRLWMAVRLTTRSAIIIGSETLGMPCDILDETSPNCGTIPLPPVMGAQLDLILIHHIQSKLRRDMLERLQKMTQANKQKTWLTTYLVTFILLHNIALITEHDAGYARKHGIKRRFARERDVEEYHLGANILLAYFHYCNKGVYPFSQQCRDKDLRALAELDDDMIQFVHETRRYAVDHRNDWEKMRVSKGFEDDFFFVSQLFQENWQPPQDL